MSEKIQSNQKSVNKPLDFGSVDNIKGRGDEQENTVKVVESKEVINSIEPTLTKEDLFEKINDVATKNISVNENKTTEKYQLFDVAKDRLRNSIPDEVKAKYTQVDNKFYFKGSTEKMAFNDKGQKLETKLNSDNGVTESLIAIAKNRGWSEIKVNGSEEFRKDVWKKASEQGIAVKGYNPSKKEIAELEQKGVEIPKKGQSFPVKKEVLSENQKAAKDFKEMSHEEAVKKHPKLAPYIAVVVALEKKMDADNLTDREKNIVMKKVQQNTVNSIEKGISPKVAIQSKQETKQQTAEQELSR